jgi:CHAT domain-containing protein
LPEVLASLAESREQVNSMAVTEEMILPRLEYTRELANHISAITPKGEADVALDFEANRAKVLSGDVSNSQIVVFATHGLLNSRYPELSGIVMSLVDKDGKTQNGFLQLKDIYNMRLNSNLVILAACETAMGEEIKGEGVIGLTRGFMYAGAKGVIASLWKVDEEATVELIKRIYQYMEKDGMISSAALRKAQISLYNEKRWSTPFYWSGFTLLGEWK